MATKIVQVHKKRNETRVEDLMHFLNIARVSIFQHNTLVGSFRIKNADTAKPTQIYEQPRLAFYVLLPVVKT